MVNMGRLSQITKDGLKELGRLLTDDSMWINKSPEGRWDVLDEDKYLQAFPRSSNRSHIPWTTESSRAVAVIQMNHDDLAHMITDHPWDCIFPIMVDEVFLSAAPPPDKVHMASRMVFKRLHAASPMLTPRTMRLIRTSFQIDSASGTWIVAEISLDDPPGYFCRRLPSGCLIQRLSDQESKVTWVEHTEVYQSLPNETNAFSFGALRMIASLQSYSERNYSFDDTLTPRIPERIHLMEFGEFMLQDLFMEVSPIRYNSSTLLTSEPATAPGDLKVHAALYSPPHCTDFLVAGAIAAFRVKHSPDFVLDTLRDGRKHHEWDVLRGYKKLGTPTQHSTGGGDPRNSVSASPIQDSSGDLLIKQVDVNPSGALVVWSTVSKKYFDDNIMCVGVAFHHSVMISGFSISNDANTTATTTCDTDITLVLRMSVEGNRSLQNEQRQQAIESITSAINQTVERVKEALDKH